MTTERGAAISWRESTVRVTALVVVISGHLGLLMLLLQPVIFYRDPTPEVKDNSHVLKLRFFQPPQSSSSHPALPAHRRSVSALHRHEAELATSPKPATVRQAPHANVPPRQLRLSVTPNTEASEGNPAGDGRFQERLHDAQRSHLLRGVPGSDTPLAPGIHLVDPLSQGVGAVMRTAQRAFGIRNKHCIDVDVWRHLTPHELSARHISSSDVNELDDKYGCSKPPGLRF